MTSITIGFNEAAREAVLVTEQNMEALKAFREVMKRPEMQSSITVEKLDILETAFQTSLRTPNPQIQMLLLALCNFCNDLITENQKVVKSRNALLYDFLLTNIKNMRHSSTWCDSLRRTQ